MYCFFFRQKTAYEMRISDWSSDVCSSDLTELAVADALVAADYLRTLDGANGKVGAVGYCLGGKLAFLLAMKPETDAAVSYYGVEIQARLDQIDEVRCPLLLQIGRAHV